MLQFRDLWRSHPINESVPTPCIAPQDLVNLEGQRVPKGVPVFHNQCAIRMGVTLRRVGVPPSLITGAATCAVHPREDMHFINASQLAHAIGQAPHMLLQASDAGRAIELQHKELLLVDRLMGAGPDALHKRATTIKLIAFSA